MRSARDGLWHQEPAFQPDLSAATVARTKQYIADSAALETKLRALTEAAVVEPTWHIMSTDFQITEKNSVFWRLSWKMSIKNYGPGAIVVSPSAEFTNRGGFIVDTDTESMVTIAAQDTAEITGSALIATSVAPSVTGATGRAKRIR